MRRRKSEKQICQSDRIFEKVSTFTIYVYTEIIYILQDSAFNSDIKIPVMNHYRTPFDTIKVWSGNCEGDQKKVNEISM